MKNIKKNIQLDIPAPEAYERFHTEIDQWWPKSYTWFANPNAQMRMNLDGNRLCKEIDTNGKELIWGRVVDVEKSDYIDMLWLIDQDRNPIEKEHRASRLKFNFIQDQDGRTEIEITHNGLEKMGDDVEEYYNLLDSDDGWMYLLRSFKMHCQHSYHLQADQI